MRKFKVDASGAGQRADVFVAGKYRGYSRSSLSLLFTDGLVKLNNKSVKAGEKLREGDSIEVDDKLINTVPPKIELPIIYEDNDVIVINKPTGVLTHSKGALNLEPTVASLIKSKIKDNNLTGNRAGIVHRLDRFTSGVIICAKNDTSLKFLQKQFLSRKVQKTYSALVEGVPKLKAAIIDAPIARNPKKPQTFMVRPDGKSARTLYKVVKKNHKSGNYSLLELSPETGRTHQLRVHMAYIGHPVVGDYIYGKEGGGMKLHAKKLALRLPSGEIKEFYAPLPKTFFDIKDEQ